MSLPTLPQAKMIYRLPQVVHDPLTNFQRFGREYGPSFMMQVGGQRRTLLTTEPAVIQHVLQKQQRKYEKSPIQTDQLATYIGHGLLTNKGEDWLRQRRLIQPGFKRGRMETLIGAMWAESQTAAETLAGAARAGAPVAIEEVTNQTAFRIISRAIFGEGFSEEELARLSEVVTRVQEFIIYPIRVPFLQGLFRTLGIERKYRNYYLDVLHRFKLRVDERRARRTPGRPAADAAGRPLRGYGRADGRGATAGRDHGAVRRRPRDDG